jgi:uncharacterized protein YggE
LSASTSVLTRTATILALAAALAAATPLTAQAADTPPPTISVSGEATVSVAPDLAEVDGGVTTQAKTAREASDGTNKAMAAVLAALKGAGIADADIRTSRLSLQPQVAPARAGDAPPAIVGYRASNRVTVRVHDITKVASTLDTLLAAGANDIGGVNFMVTNASKWLDEARPKAIADARRKAEIYAKAAVVTLGAPLSISEGSFVGAMAPRGFAAAPMAAAPVPIAAGDETLTVTVSVSYEIKPATP